MTVEPERRFLIIHGVENHRPPGHWQHHLAELLRADGEIVLYPQLPDADSPHLDRWLTLLAAELAQLGRGERVVICHSLACLLWMHHATSATAAQAVDRVLLVSPPSATQLWPAIQHFAPPPEVNREHLGRAARSETRVIASSADPYCPESAERLYAAPLGLAIDVIETPGHFSESDGYGPWPSLYDWCRDPTTRIRANR
jgi:predicted alpha/beta hydrolase family esterase